MVRHNSTNQISAGEPQAQVRATMSTKVTILIVGMSCFVTGMLMERYRAGSATAQPTVDNHTEHQNIATSDQETSTNTVAPSSQSDHVKNEERTPDQQHPTIFIEQAEYHFGEVLMGEWIRHDWIIENRGSAPLVIHDTKRSDLSIAFNGVQLKKEKIEPGEQYKVHIAIPLSNRNGPFEESITLFTNDPQNAEISMRLLGDVVSLVKKSPKIIDAGDVPDGQNTVVVEAEVETLRDLEFDIVGYRSSDDNIEVEVETIEKGRKFRAKITIHAPEKRGKFQGWTHLRTSRNDQYAIIPFAVRANFIDAAQQLYKPLNNSNLVK